MDNTTQNIEGGTLLNSIINMFFKGLNNLLDAAAEYEEELGVLKQVTRLTVTDKSKNKYSLTIKLSPVKNKQGLYYVEAETDCPKLDVSSIDKKTMKINNSNMKQFNAMIDKIIKDSGLEWQPTSNDSNSDADDAEIDSEDNNSEGNEVLELGRQLEEEMESYAETSFAGPDNEPLDINWKLVDQDSTDKIVFELYVTKGEDELEEFEPKLIKLSAKDDKGDFRSIDDLKSDFIDEIDEYRDEVSNQINASTSVVIEGVNDDIREDSDPTLSATFFKDSKTEQVELTAIKASCDVQTAIDIIDALSNDEEFASCIEPDSEKSFSIVDEGDDFNIEEIDCVDAEVDYTGLFNRISSIYCYIKAIEWALGSYNYHGDSLLSGIPYPINSLMDNFAFWVIKHTNCYPVICNHEINCTIDLTEYKDNKGDLDRDMIKQDIVDRVNALLDELDVYYVNFEHEEQAVLDQFINELDRLLVYG